MFGRNGFKLAISRCRKNNEQNSHECRIWAYYSIFTGRLRSSKAGKQQPCFFISLSLVSLISLLNAGHVGDWNTLKLCWGLSADTQKNERAVKQGTSKKWQEESREESVSIFLNTSICLLPEKKTFVVSTYQNFPCCGLGRFHNAWHFC